MSTTSKPSHAGAAALRKSAQEHLWLHFSQMSDFEKRPLPIIVSGEGSYLTDVDGKTFLDGLAGLFAVQIGYSHGEEIGEAAAAQMRELPYYTNWNYAHPRAIELAEEVASLAPDGFNRVFFTSGGAESVEAAWKIARQYHALNGERRWKAIGRDVAYHGTTMGALSITGVESIRSPFEPLVPQVSHVRNTDRFHRPEGETEEQFTAMLLDDMEHRILSEGPETIAMIILEPVQNSAAPSPRPRATSRASARSATSTGSCSAPTRSSRASAASVESFGSIKYDIKPDLITSAKGLSSAYASIGALIVSDRVAEPFYGQDKMFSHGITFGGHPVQTAIALKNIEIMKRLDVVGNVATNADAFRNTLNPLLDIPIVGDVRGTGYFYALELVKDKDTKQGFTAEEGKDLLQNFLSDRLHDAGLICRADDRGEPVIQVSPPLVAGQEEFDKIAGILGTVLTEAAERVR